MMLPRIQPLNPTRIATPFGSIESWIPRPATGNVAHDRLLALSESDQALYLGMVVGEGCRGVEAFYMGMHPENRIAFWSVRCSDGKSYNVSIDADAVGSTKVLECSVLKYVAG